MTETVWIALSASGSVVPFMGFALKRKDLADAYANRFGHDLETAGYRAVKATLTYEPPETPKEA